MAISLNESETGDKGEVFRDVHLITDTVPEFLDLETELPVVRDDRQVSGYVRMEQKSGLIGIYEKADPNAIWLDGCPWEAEHELFDADYDRIMPWLEKWNGRLPGLEAGGGGLRWTLTGRRHQSAQVEE